jgi:hypothetical protein
MLISVNLLSGEIKSLCRSIAVRNLPAVQAGRTNDKHRLRPYKFKKHLIAALYL